MKLLLKENTHTEGDREAERGRKNEHEWQREKENWLKKSRQTHTIVFHYSIFVSIITSIQCLSRSTTYLFRTP